MNVGLGPPFQNSSKLQQQQPTKTKSQNWKQQQSVRHHPSHPPSNPPISACAGKPSRVIHIRNIPNESSEAEVIQLGVPFGRVTNVLVLKGKNQAFLEMADEVSAAAMVACFNNSPPQVRGRTVYVQFSNHRELKTDQSHSVAVSVLFFVFFFFFIFVLRTDRPAPPLNRILFPFCFSHFIYFIHAIYFDTLAILLLFVINKWGHGGPRRWSP